MPKNAQVAYFSMEIAIDPAIPTYAGGLGVLAGDTLRAAADLGVPLVAVSLVHRKGYLGQLLDASGWQTEEPLTWNLEESLEEQPARVSVVLDGQTVHVRAWKKEIIGARGRVPVILLDTDLPENPDWARRLTDELYGGDDHYRLCQEAVLGIGGIRMLRQLCSAQLRQYHMNEGHAALLALELLDEEIASSPERTMLEQIQAVHDRCVFTTHTPVAAGHDRFPIDLVNRVLGRPDLFTLKEVFCCDDVLNMTFLAMNLSHFINGVAKRHGEVARHMYAHYDIESITNGIHVGTWAAPAFQDMFDKYIPTWRSDNFSLRYALSISSEELWEAHQTEKQRLLEQVKKLTSIEMSSDVFTIGFARRATAYKRPELLFHDIERLKRIAREQGPLQLIFSGKAHPRDVEGKKLIQYVVGLKDSLLPEVTLTWLPDYDMRIAQQLVAGCDLWLNTPKPPLEASGTSGMKAAVNGVPSLSIPDGWWIEGGIEGVTGWSIGEDARNPEVREDGVKDAASLYEKLETVILPTFHNQRTGYVEVMRHCIALNGSFFNTQRMMQQYVQKAYF